MTTPFRIIVSSEAPAGWDDVLLAGDTGSLHLFQSTVWAERLAKFAGDSARYVSVYDGDTLRAMLLAFEEARRPAHGTGLRRLVATVRARIGRRGFHWYGRPALFGAGHAELRALGEWLVMYARDRGLRLVGGEWPTAFEAALPAAWRWHRWGTLKVDLSGDLSDIVHRFKPAARKEIKKAEAQRIEVRRIDTPEGLRNYAEEAVVCAARYGKTNASVDDYLCCWHTLRRSPFVFETFAAYRGDEFIAGLSVWGSTRGIGELGSFQTQRAFEEKLSGPDLIKWRVIEWAKGSGIDHYDLAGVNPAPTDPKEQGIRRFKEKWGGVYEEYLVVEG